MTNSVTSINIGMEHREEGTWPIDFKLELQIAMERVEVFRAIRSDFRNHLRWNPKNGRNENHEVLRALCNRYGLMFNDYVAMVGLEIDANLDYLARKYKDGKQ